MEKYKNKIYYDKIPKHTMLNGKIQKYDLL